MNLAQGDMPRLRDEALSEYDRAKTEDEKSAIAERLREKLNRQ